MGLDWEADHPFVGLAAYRSSEVAARLEAEAQPCAEGADHRLVSCDWDLATGPSDRDPGQNPSGRPGSCETAVLGPSVGRSAGWQPARSLQAVPDDPVVHDGAFEEAVVHPNDLVSEGHIVDLAACRGVDGAAGSDDVAT